MGILNRLGNVIKSYVNYGELNNHDPDLGAAYEELDDFLRGNDKGRAKAKYDEKTAEKPIPEEIKKAFAELGLTPDATAEKCKETYKMLLKTHHPDRHVKHEGNLKKATDKTKRVNAAYELLTKWFNCV